MGVGRQFSILPLYPVLSGRLLRREGRALIGGALYIFRVAIQSSKYPSPKHYDR